MGCRLGKTRELGLVHLAVTLVFAGCGGVWEGDEDRIVEILPTPVPGFALVDPSLPLVTADDPGRHLRLSASSYGPHFFSFRSLLQDRALGEEVIRSLVTLTDMTDGSPVPYAIGDPVEAAGEGEEHLDLTPIAPLAMNSWYRVTLYPGETQQLAHCHTRSMRTHAWLTAPETLDIYTYSRPMVGWVLVAYKDGTKGYIDFLFSEVLPNVELDAYPMAVVAVDGVELAGCLSRYACFGNAVPQTLDLRLDLENVPTSFAEITLRISHGLKSVNGGTILEGTKDNPHAVVDGDWAVYTFKAADMILVDNSSNKHWYHVGR